MDDNWTRGCQKYGLVATGAGLCARILGTGADVWYMTNAGDVHSTVAQAWSLIDEVLHPIGLTKVSTDLHFPFGWTVEPPA